MSDNPLSFKNILAGIVVTILGGIPLAIIIQDARFAPQQSQNSPTPSNSPTKVTESSTFTRSTSTPPSSSTPIPKPKLEPTISGKWVGTYVCSQGVIGVTIDIDQTGNSVIADFRLYPPPENSDIPRDDKKYEGSDGRATYKGDYNSISRYIRFPEGEWSKSPGLFWRAFGFQGQFHEDLETFTGKMDHYPCKTFNLRKKDN